MGIEVVKITMLQGAKGDGVAELQNEVNNMQNELAALGSRMDQFVRLPDGSTTGDAELADIRVGANGVTYPTAGDAVRVQVDAANKAFESVLVKEAFTTTWAIGSISSNTGANSNSTNRIRSYYYLKADGAITISADEGYKFNWFRYAGESAAGYNKDTDYSGGWRTGSVTVPGGYYYRFCAAEAGDETITVAADVSAHISLSYEKISDPSLSLPGRAADSKKVGDEMKKLLSLNGPEAETIPNGANIDTYRNIGTYKVIAKSAAQSMANLPEESPGMLLVGIMYADTRFMQMYFAYENKNVYIRYGTDTAWSEWRGLTDVGWELSPAIPSGDDVDTYRSVGAYRVTSSSAASGIANLPTVSAGILTVSNTYHRTRFFQLFYAHGNNAIYYRFGTDSAWDDWKITGRTVTPTDTSAETVLIFGDSWADEATSGATKWPTYFVQETNVTVKNYSKNGSSVYGTDDYHTNGTVGGQVAAAISDSSIERGDVSTIFMMCGLNDFRSGRGVATVLSAWRTLIDRIRTVFPGARIICCLNSQIFVNTDQLNYLRGLQDGLRQYGVPAYLILGWFPAALYNNDHVHPSETAHAMIATNMVSLFRGGSLSFAQNKYVQNGIGSYISELAITEMFTDSYITRKIEVIKTANLSELSQDVTIRNSSPLAVNIPFGFPAFNGEDGNDYIVIKGTSAETILGDHRLAETDDLTILMPISGAGKFGGYTMV